MGSPRESTRILGLKGYRVDRLEWEADGPRARVRIWIEPRGVRGYECSGCGRRTWRVRDAKERTWDDLPWAEHCVTLVYSQRRVRCRTCGIRTDAMLLLKLKWATARPIRSSRDLARFLQPEPLYSNR